MNCRPTWFSLCIGNLWFSGAELLVVLPRFGTPLFLGPRGLHSWVLVSRCPAVSRW